MKPMTRQTPPASEKDHTRLYFNIFMALLGLGMIYMIVLLFMV
jgi:hypothetical protein